MDVPALHLLISDKDDEARWLVALISATGLRLAEAAGLAMRDIYLDEQVPHISIRIHPWRRLKTRSSERVVPLVGASLWAAKRLHQKGRRICFPALLSSDTRLGAGFALSNIHPI